MFLFSIDYMILVSILVFCKITKSATKEELTYIIKNDEVRSQFAKLLTSLANVNEQRIDALKKFNALDTYNLVSGNLRDAEQIRNLLVVILPSNDYKLKATDLLNEIYSNGPSIIPEKTARHDLTQIYQDEPLEFRNGDNINTLFARLKNPGRTEKGIKTQTIVDSDDSDSDSDGSDIKEKPEHIKTITANLITTPLVETENNGLETKPTNDLNEVTDDTKLGSVESLRIWKSYSKKAVKKCRKACKAAYKSTCKDFKCSKSMKKKFKKSCKYECRKKFD